MSNYKRPESVLVVVYTQTKKVLVLHRHQPDYFWQSVAGSLCTDEAPLTAALRELKEETGIVVSALTPYQTSRYIIYPMWRDRYAPGVVENTEYAYTLELEQECEIKLDEREHIEYEWVDSLTAQQRIASYTNRVFVKRIMSLQ